MVPGSGNHRVPQRDYSAQQAELEKLAKKKRNPATAKLRLEDGHFRTGRKARFKIWGLRVLRIVVPFFKGRIEKNIGRLNAINTQQQKAAVSLIAEMTQNAPLAVKLKDRSVITLETAKNYIKAPPRYTADQKTWIYPPTLDKENPWRTPLESLGLTEENPPKEPDQEAMIESLVLDYRIIRDDQTIQDKISQEIAAAKQQQQALQQESKDLDDKTDLHWREEPIQKFKELVKNEFPDETDESKSNDSVSHSEGEFVHQDIPGTRKISTEFHTIENSGEAGEAHCQGLRSTMEDATLYTTIRVKTSTGEQRLVVSGMFDGHGGAEAAEFAKRSIAQDLEKRLEEGSPEKLDDTRIWNALKLAFVDTSNRFRPSEGICGTTANLVLQNPENGDIWVANAGDSRALLVSPEGECTQVSEDAKPSVPKYKKSVEKRGGTVFEPKSKNSPARVNDMLSTARGLGDHFTYGATTPRPKITKYSKPAGGWDGHTLIQACDGVFDVATTDAIGNVAYKMKQKGASHAQIAGAIVSLSYRAGSADNISAMAIPLR